MAPIRVPGGQIVFGGGQYPQQQVSYEGQQPQQSQQRFERCYVKLGADAPQPTVQVVESATVAKIQSLFAESCFQNNGQRGEWPDLGQVEEVVKNLFKQKGLNLSAGNEGSPGCFKVMEYKPGLPPG